MATTEAIVAWEPTKTNHVNWSLEEVDVGMPGEGEVFVEMSATGICHTDIVLSSVPAGRSGINYPKVVGHEGKKVIRYIWSSRLRRLLYKIGSGIVRFIGRNVTTVLVGDPVLLSYNSCGSCKQCRDSHPAYCDAFAPENYIGRQGSMSIKETREAITARFFGQSSFARYSVVSERSIVNVKELLHNHDELKLFAPLGCGFQTGMGAICNTSSAGPDDTVMIMGLGAVGMGALMVSRPITHLPFSCSS
jgi:Zn-dependent alcohol dehydrogenase